MMAFAQAGQPAGSGVGRGIALVENGKCQEAIPVLKRGLPAAKGEEKYHAQMALVRCAMALDQEQTAVDTLLTLKRENPNDPEVLYISTHYFSELGMRAARQLQTVAPDSYQEQRLEAETLESEGKNDEAAAVYNKILAANPKVTGIHYRLGQIALAKAGDSGPTDDAKVEFEKELQVDPTNAAAEFILGELARRAANWDEAIKHFSRATSLDAGFSEAYLALGMSLGASGKYADAVKPLTAYTKMEPGDPAGHYQLAQAYSHTGDKAGATRELELQRQAASRAKATDNAEGHAVHP
jgi:tetratricopeptide (TPR) repeat protein